jgi:hypothetical protein
VPKPSRGRDEEATAVDELDDRGRRDEPAIDVHHRPGRTARPEHDGHHRQAHPDRHDRAGEELSTLDRPGRLLGGLRLVE